MSWKWFKQRTIYNGNIEVHEWLKGRFHDSAHVHESKYFFFAFARCCWFASDVTAAMLGVKNKSVSLRWEMNSILMQILPKNFFCIDHQHGRLVTRFANQE